MANEKVIGNKFFLRLTIDSVETFIVCEQESGIEVSSEDITVLCKTSGEWAETLEGGTKSGSINYSGAYVKDPSSPNLSAFTLLGLVGTVQDAIWGGIEDGDDIVEAPVKISSVSITSNTNEAITFSGTLTIAGEPTVGTYTT
jgi:predicted secreted protein